MPRKHTPIKNKSGSQQPIRVIRQSGLPVEPTHLKAYNADYAKMFDKVLLHIDADEKTALSQEQADRINKLLERLDKMLLRQYPAVQQWPFLSYTKLQKKLRYFDAAIQMTLEKTTGRVVYIIMDLDREMEKQQQEQENQKAAFTNRTMTPGF